MVPFDRLGVVSYGNFVPKTHRFQILDMQVYSDLETGVMGHSSHRK